MNSKVEKESTSKKNKIGSILNWIVSLAALVLAFLSYQNSYQENIKLEQEVSSMNYYFDEVIHNKSYSDAIVISGTLKIYNNSNLSSIITNLNFHINQDTIFSKHIFPETAEIPNRPNTLAIIGNDPKNTLPLTINSGEFEVLKFALLVKPKVSIEKKLNSYRIDGKDKHPLYHFDFHRTLLSDSLSVFGNELISMRKSEGTYKLDKDDGFSIVYGNTSFQNSYKPYGRHMLTVEIRTSKDNTFFSFKDLEDSHKWEEKYLLPDYEFNSP